MFSYFYYLMVPVQHDILESVNWGFSWKSDYYSNVCGQYAVIFFTFYSSKNPKKMYPNFHKNIQQLFPTL